MALKSGRVGIHPSQVDPITGMLLSGPSGSTNYNDLSNKPQINGVTLSGNKTTSDLHIASDLSDLDDITISNPELGQLLVYDGNKWENQFASISPVTPASLASLQDVDLNSPAAGQTLKYNGTSQKWENENFPIIPTKTSDLINDSGYITTPGYVWTSGVSALAGATSATITDANITTNSIIEVFASVQGLQEPTLAISTGSCVLTFSTLAQDTTFKLRIS